MRSFYVETLGCQMNKADSERVAGLFLTRGWKETQDPSDAELILVNGCAVRLKAEKRAVNRANEYVHTFPGAKVALIGCVAEWQGQELLNTLPGLHLLVSPARLNELPDLAKDGGIALGHTMWGAERTEPRRGMGIRAWIPVMRGCDQNCSFCVVPATRGTQVSFPPSFVMERAVDALESGYIELVLLGQRVSAYSYRGISFAALLKQLAALPGLRRIRFTAPYPSDIGDDLLEVMASSDVVEKRLHLPLQSGSDRVLKLMGRGYTITSYLDLVERARALIPGLGLSTDLIVGFPGETEADFGATLAVVRAVGFDTAFTFAYSPRPGTVAASLQDQVPAEVSQERLARLVSAHHEVLAEKRKEEVGAMVKVLVEGPDRKDPHFMMGKTSNGRVVILEGDFASGDEVSARVIGLRGHTLRAAHVRAGGYRSCGS